MKAADDIIGALDAAGSHLTLAQWAELLDEVGSAVDLRLDAARNDQRNADAIVARDAQLKKAMEKE